jgi:hypothetical protein
MKISPQARPDAVMDLYSDVRKAALEEIRGSSRPRAMSPENAELAAFAAEHGPTTWDPRSQRWIDVKPWSDLLAEWNQEHPERRFSDVRRFTRDVREAWERVTGQALDWHTRSWARHE